MTDLERLVRRLVEVLERQDPDSIHRPIGIGELRGHLLPYRTHRGALGVSSSEDYELLVLRLLAEEGDFVRTNPPAAAARARDEVASPNPNLDLVEELGDATVQIGAPGLARINELVDDPPLPRHRVSADLPFIEVEPPRPEAVLGPPPPPPPPSPAPVAVEPAIVEIPQFEALEPVTVPAPEAAPDLPTGPSDKCPACSGVLPTGRSVIFCPFCGHQIGVGRCAVCGAELEPGWRHCITCGHRAGPTAVA